MKLPRLREVRELRGWSQGVLAEKAGVSRDSISNYETGHRQAYPATARKLADALSVSIADLIEPVRTEELVGAGKAEAPREAGRNPKTDEINLRYRPYRIGLERLCEHWEKRLAADDLDRRSLEEFFVTAECLVPTILTEIINSELAELLEVVGGEPRNELTQISEFWPACNRYMQLGEELARTGREKFPEDGTEHKVIKLADFQRGLGRRAG